MDKITVDKFTSKLFYVAIENVHLCSSMNPMRFWLMVGQQIAWCRKLDDPQLLSKFVRKCMNARVIYKELDPGPFSRSMGLEDEVVGGESEEESVPAWRAELSVAVTKFDNAIQRATDGPTLALYLGRSFIDSDPEGEGPVRQYTKDHFEDIREEKEWKEAECERLREEREEVEHVREKMDDMDIDDYDAGEDDEAEAEAEDTEAMMDGVEY
ncbi:hypothetical protein F5X99DRAFT_408006 [Biscogniauxia marginata]|nr:hypothetical protein F5X99DRAFT_408006 [Biscogniauxia marginata]